MPAKTYIRDPKKRGEWAEAQFLAKAEQYGLTVSKPWGDSSRYDFAIEHQGRFMRIQVKSTLAFCYDGYVCTLLSNGSRYSTDEVDFFALYVIPVDVWCIVPAEIVTQLKKRIMLAPQRKGHKYERFKEAWDLLSGGTKDMPTPLPRQSGDTEVEVEAEDVPVSSGVSGAIESLSGLAESDDPSAAFSKRLANSFEFVRTQLRPRRG